MTQQPAPFSRSFDLGSLGSEERVVELVPNGSERDAIAVWAGLEGLEGLTATVRVKRTGNDHYDYRATFAANVVQSCVVTLAPVRSTLEGAFERQYHVLPARARRLAPEEEVATGDDDVETLSTNTLDLAGPVLEELLLAIDPYPRAPDAEFESPKDEGGEELPRPNPFAALKTLKDKG